MSKVDFYAVLGVGHGANQAQVARAFRKLAFRWHPDRNASQPELAHQQFLLVHQAYEVLSDPARRREFDSLHRPETHVRRKTPAPHRPRPKAAYVPPPPPTKPPVVSKLTSRVAWFILGGAIQVLGFLAMLFLGPVAERRTSDDVERKLPWIVDFVFPLGRLALAAGVATLAVWALNNEMLDVHFPVILLAIGGFIFLIERIVLASFWVVGRRRSRGS